MDKIHEAKQAADELPPGKPSGANSLNDLFRDLDQTFFPRLQAPRELNSSPDRESHQNKTGRALSETKAKPVDSGKESGIPKFPQLKELDKTQTVQLRKEKSEPKYPDGSKWTGSNFNTDEPVSLSTVKAGHTVEIDPFGHELADGFIKAAQDKGAKVVAYLPGGHGYKWDSPDNCNQFQSAAFKRQWGDGVEFGKTGAVWENKGERRILDQSHPGFVSAQEKRFLDVLRLGANGARYDNLHSPSGGTMATETQVLAIYNAFTRAKASLQQSAIQNSRHKSPPSIRNNKWTIQAKPAGMNARNRQSLKR